MQKADARIVIDTRVRKDKAEADLKELKARAKNTADAISKIDKQMEQLGTKKSKLTEQLQEARENAESLEKSLENVRASMNRAYAKELTNQQKLNPKATADEQKKAAHDAVVNSAFGKQGLADIERHKSELEKTGEVISQLEQEIAGLEDQSEKLSVTQGDLNQRLSEENAAVDKATKRFSRLKAEVETFNRRIQTASKSGLEKFATRIKGLAARVFVFSMITRALRSVVSFMGNALSQTDGFNKALARLRGAAYACASPLIEALGGALTYIINALATAFSYLARFISMLTGKSIGAMKSGAKAMSGVGKAAGGTAKKVDEAKKSLAAFDEINTLDTSQPDNSSGGGAGAGGVDFGALDSAGTALDGLFKKIADDLKSINLEPLIAAWGRLKAAAEPVLEKLSSALVWLWDNAIFPLTKWTAEEALPRFLDVLSGCLGVLNSVLEAFAPAWQWLWDNFLLPLAEFTGGLITDFLDWLTEKLTELKTWIDDNQESLTMWLEILGGVVAILGVLVIGVGLVNTAIGVLTGAVSLISALMSHWIIVVTAVAAAIAAIVVWAGNGEEALGYLKDAFDSFINLVKALLEGDWAAVWDSAKRVAIDALNLIIVAFESLVKLIATGLNKLIDGVNSIGGKVGINIPTFSTDWQFKRIPYLAQGAVIPPNNPYLAVVGDQRSGTNIEAPLDTIVEAFRQAQAGQTVTIKFEGELAQLGRVLKPVIDRENHRVGRNLVKGAVINAY